jgi:predicted porin
LSGVIQAEGGEAEIGKNNGEKPKDPLRTSTDTYGSVANGGPNRLRFDIEEKIGDGLTAFGRYQAPFNTTNSDGLGKGQDAYVGLKTANLRVLFGRIEGVYKTSKQYLDPFAGTAIQARGTAGGMSGSARTEMTVTENPNGKFTVKDPKKGTTYRADIASVPFKSTNDAGLSHGGEVKNTLEVGLKFGDFSATAQGVFDKVDPLMGEAILDPVTKEVVKNNAPTQRNGIGLAELKYIMQNLTIFAAGSYLSSDVLRSLTIDPVTNKPSHNNHLKNWKVGGQFKAEFGSNAVILGLQYEDAEIGAFDPNPSGGKYIMGSMDYKLSNVLIGGWVAQYSSDIADKEKWTIGGTQIGEDALNWAVGIKYLFSARTLAYMGYLQTDSDNNYRDQKIYGGGLRHSF